MHLWVLNSLKSLPVKHPNNYGELSPRSIDYVWGLPVKLTYYLFLLLIPFSAVSGGKWDQITVQSVQSSVPWKSVHKEGGGAQDYIWDKNSSDESCKAAHELVKYSVIQYQKEFIELGLANKDAVFKSVITEGCDDYIPGKPSHLDVNGSSLTYTTIVFDILGYVCDGEQKYSKEGVCNNDNENISPEKICSGKPSFQGEYNNVYFDNGNYFIYVDGCEYEGSGIIVCNESKTVCAADWKPSGSVAQTSDTESEPTKPDSGGDNGGDNGEGDNNGSGSDGSSGGNNEKPYFDYVENAKKIKEQLTEPVSKETIAFIHRDIKSDLDKINSLSGDFSKNINSLINGEGDIKGDENLGGSYGLAQGYLGIIGNDINDSILSPFINLEFDHFFPQLPQPKSCESLVFGSGEVYEFSVDCKYINMFKGVFGFILYIMTFLYFINSLVGLNRNKEV